MAVREAAPDPHRPLRKGVQQFAGERRQEMHDVQVADVRVDGDRLEQRSEVLGIRLAGSPVVANLGHVAGAVESDAEDEGLRSTQGFEQPAGLGLARSQRDEQRQVAETRGFPHAIGRAGDRVDEARRQIGAREPAANVSARDEVGGMLELVVFPAGQHCVDRGPDVRRQRPHDLVRRSDAGFITDRRPAAAVEQLGGGVRGQSGSVERVGDLVGGQIAKHPRCRGRRQRDQIKNDVGGREEDRERLEHAPGTGRLDRGAGRRRLAVVRGGQRRRLRSRRRLARCGRRFLSGSGTTAREAGPEAKPGQGSQHGGTGSRRDHRGSMAQGFWKTHASSMVLSKPDVHGSGPF